MAANTKVRGLLTESYTKNFLKQSFQFNSIYYNKILCKYKSCQKYFENWYFREVIHYSKTITEQQC